MLSIEYGRMIRGARSRQGLSQAQLAHKAGVARGVLSALELGKPKPIQSDTLDRLLGALEIRPAIGKRESEDARRIARLEHQVRVAQQRERHLRLALELMRDGKAARAKVVLARERVALWRREKSCSPFYVDRWSNLLAGSPRNVASRMGGLGDWEEALFQNSPWSWAWN